MAQSGHTNVIKTLHACGINVNIGLSDGTTPACIAAENKHFNVIRVLFKINSDIAYLAVKNKETNLILALHEAGINLNHITDDGSDALLTHYAACYGHANVIHTLHELKVDINQKDSHGFTPIQIAAQMGKTEAIKAFFQCGVDLNQETTDGLTLVHLATCLGHFNLIKMFHELKMNLNQESSFGFTPIQLAAQYKQTEVIKALHEHGVSLNQTTKEGGASLVHLAAEEGNAEIIKLLYKYGVNMNQATTDKAQATPLWLAAQHNHIDAFKILLRCNKVNYQAPPSKISKQELTSNATEEQMKKIDIFLSSKQPVEDDLYDVLPHEIAYLLGHDEIINAFNQFNQRPTLKLNSLGLYRHQPANNENDPGGNNTLNIGMK